MKTTSPLNHDKLDSMMNRSKNVSHTKPAQLPAQLQANHLGLVFYHSECGRHICVENVQVIVDGVSRIAALAYVTGDRGERTLAFVNRQLYGRPPHFEPVEIRNWIDPVPSSVFYPHQLVSMLTLVVRRTREWVQLQARSGWTLPYPCVPSSGEYGRNSLPAA